MPARETNQIDYVEIPSRDLAQTKAFFSALFGWTFTDYGPEYTCFHDGQVSGGFYISAEISRVARGGVLIVFYSPDLEASLQRVRELGATITNEIFTFPGGRRFHFAEPGGSELAIWSDK